MPIGGERPFDVAEHGIGTPPADIVETGHGAGEGVDDAGDRKCRSLQQRHGRVDQVALNRAGSGQRRKS
jgi:hypothetical protein